MIRNCVHECMVPYENGGRCKLYENPEHTNHETCMKVSFQGNCRFQEVEPDRTPRLSLGDTGILGTEAEPDCPVCGADRALGYYGDWCRGGELECETCGSVINVEPVTEWHFTVITIGTKQKRSD